MAERTAGPNRNVVPVAMHGANQVHQIYYNACKKLAPLQRPTTPTKRFVLDALSCAGFVNSPPSGRQIMGMAYCPLPEDGYPNMLRPFLSLWLAGTRPIRSETSVDLAVSLKAGVGGFGRNKAVSVVSGNYLTSRHFGVSRPRNSNLQRLLLIYL